MHTENNNIVYFFLTAIEHLYLEICYRYTQAYATLICSSFVAENSTCYVPSSTGNLNRKSTV